MGIFNGAHILLSNIRVQGLVYVQQAKDVRIEQSQLGRSETTGVSFVDSQGELTGSDVRDNDYGVTVAGRSNDRIADNVIANSQYEGIVIQKGSMGEVMRNRLINNGGGIAVQDGAHAELTENKIVSSSP